MQFCLALLRPVGLQDPLPPREDEKLQKPLNKVQGKTCSLGRDKKLRIPISSYRIKTALPEVVMLLTHCRISCTF